ncbi:MAG: ribosome-binding factor A [Patescibacteria group bacterium]
MSKRTEQVSELIRQKLGEIIIREIELPKNVLITVVKVETSADLKYAKIWLTVTPTAATGVAYGLVRGNYRELRRLLAEEIDLQFAPQLLLRLDKTAIKVAEVEQLLQEIKAEKETE